MDESWRTRMGMPTKQNLPRRRSTEDISHRPETPLLDPEDFKDVFGGPPRSVVSRQFSGNEYLPRSSSSTSSFYEEIFRKPVNLGSNPGQERNGRSLPDFRIPAEKGPRGSDRFEGFYSDIFGWKEEEEVKRSRTRSRSKSKTSSSSVLSSEDLSPLRWAVGSGGGADHGDHPDVSLFASKLRPLNVPRRWNSRRQMDEENLRNQGTPTFSSNNPSYTMEYDYNIENLRSFHYGFCQRNPSPETISLEPNSYRSLKVSADDLELTVNSPSSVVSSLCDQEQEGGGGDHENHEDHHEMFQEQDQEDEVMSSYVIEINNCDNRDLGSGEEAIGVDEAIAWAKEKFQTHCNSVDMPIEDQFSNGHQDRNESTHTLGDEKPDNWRDEEGKQHLEHNMEMELLDEKIRLWSAGKEADIRLLLSTLHHILWPESGWLSVPLTNLIESSHVKKAYQKARLFLHPDKLQQRGATFPQKYVAEKAFPILQEGWAAFVSQGVF